MSALALLVISFVALALQDAVAPAPAAHDPLLAPPRDAPRTLSLAVHDAAARAWLHGEGARSVPEADDRRQAEAAREVVVR